MSLLCACALHAQEGAQPLFEVRDAGNGHLAVHFATGHVAVVDAGNGYAALDAPSLICQAPRAGLPALPQASRLLALPRGTAVQLEQCRAEHDTVLSLGAGRRLMPWQGPNVKDAPSLPVADDKEVYSSPTPYRHSQAPFEIEDLGIMGDRQLIRLTVHPATYLPKEGTLAIATSLSAILTVTPADAATAAGTRMLIVSRPQFREGLQPFVRWKRQTGLEVTEIYADTHLRDSIRALIHAEFDERWPERWPRYILLVGDAAQMQSFIGTTRPAGLEMHTTDLYYAEHTGDYLPDALLGRWPVNDTAELGAVVRKTLRYEQFRDLDTNHLKRLLLVAGTEGEEPAPITTNGQVNYVTREAILAHPDLDTLVYRNPASALQRTPILSDLNQGAALLNYTAHCTTAGWSSPSVSFQSIDTLGNNQPLLYVNNCCHSNAFAGTCFGEQLLRKPVGGAIGVVGATNSTLWEEDYYWAVGPKQPFALAPAFDPLCTGAFDHWLGRIGDVHTAGSLLAAGNLAVTAFGSSFAKYYWEIYCLLGDPSLEPWLGIPPALAPCLLAESLHHGDASLALTGTPHATVTAMQRDTLLGTGVVGADGGLELLLGQSLDTTPLVITATLSGHRPRIDTLAVLPTDGVAVALHGVAATDSIVSCRLENIGSLPLHNLTVTLRPLVVDSETDAVVATQQTEIDTLLAAHQRVLAFPLQVLTWGQMPEWRAELTVGDSTGAPLRTVTLQHRMGHADYPTASFRLLEADGSESNHLLPRHDYLIETLVEGLWDSADLVVTALPTGDSLSSAHFTSSVLQTPLSTPDTVTHLHLEATLHLGHHQRAYSHYIVGGSRQESFETGADSYPWQMDGPLPWQIDSTASHSGRYCLRSGNIDHRQMSDLSIDVLLPQDDTLIYWARTSSEVPYDKLQFLIDGERHGNELWGESTWRRYVHVIGAGRHTLTWRYLKDASGSAGSDCAWIDDVQLPHALWGAPYGWFGDSSMLAVDTPEFNRSPLRLYPNPSQGTVIVDCGGRTLASLRVLDLYGRVLYSSTNIATTPLDLRHLPDGVYLIEAHTPTENLHQKLIIRH
jgi:hypothetical protein